MPFATAHLEIFHCTHRPLIPKSDLYFTFSSTLKALSKRTYVKITVNGLIKGFGKSNEPQQITLMINLNRTSQGVAYKIDSTEYERTCSSFFLKIVLV